MMLSLRSLTRERWRDCRDVTRGNDRPEPANAVLVSIKIDQDNCLRCYARNILNLGGILVGAFPKLPVADTLWRLPEISALEEDSCVVTSALLTDPVDILDLHCTVNSFHC